MHWQKLEDMLVKSHLIFFFCFNVIIKDDVNGHIQEEQLQPEELRGAVDLWYNHTFAGKTHVRFKNPRI